MEKKFLSTRVIIYIAVLGALATLVMFFEFPILPMAPFLKVDLSDVVTIIGGTTFGPVAGILIAFIRSIVNWILKGSGLIGLIGNFAGFIGSIAVMLPAVLLKNKNVFLKIIISVFSLTIISALVNYFFLMPAYMILADMKIGMPLMKYILTIVIPFNLIKGSLVMIISMIVYNRMKDYLKKNEI
ncbi:riboflavin transporter [Companilactobacillus sp. RD055328]|uniref:ECF transporter S component n=1 Tax=Companilactobacillus sp. RD055328 TaxID=2916634 RepID=UPI001FC812B6|nr:ECF transporter S component [Companilactobacillus sp. RD055328]GKQ42738.1 riboflavin transporter [Companilactobacillus sp. RD055328]